QRLTAMAAALALGAGAAAQDDGSASSGLSAEGLAQLEAVTHGWVDEGRLAGVATLIARHGEIAHL
ncbi:MAG: serine hydrolase, partial [Gammaproteobacteria bacterium]|nr:serine hydrolase [Gammaproteobacteria bacterium]